MKRYSIVVAFFISILSYAQVGIGVTEPQQQLHIGGDATETVRIEGLNSTNNVNNTGIRKQPVYTNADGDLIIPPSPARVELIFDERDFMNYSYYLSTGVFGEARQAEIYRTLPFTLTQAAHVLISYSASYFIRRWATGHVIHDGKPRIIQNYFYIGNGFIPDFSTAYGMTGTSYTNNKRWGHAVAIGNLHSSSSDIVYLPAGTYSIHIYGAVVASGDLFFFPKVSDGFTIQYGTWGDTLRVIAFY